MQGLHLTADLSGCRSGSVLMTDAPALLAALVAAVQTSGLRAVSQLAYQFPASSHGPGGVTATVLLAESHACIHTWPEQLGVTLDVYVCNFGGDHSDSARTLLHTLINLFDPLTQRTQTIHRGV
jgi:S-adenosylmethionine decarboxylase